MLKGLKRFIKKIVLSALNFEKETEEQKRQKFIDKINSSGGYCADDVYILDSKIDMLNPYLLRIGKSVTITGARILTHDATTKMHLGYTKIGKVHIGNNVFIGNQSVILPDTVIGDNVIIGAGCVVSKDIPSNSVVVGNPCKIICTLDEYLEKMKKNMKVYPCVDLLPIEIDKEENIKIKEDIIKAGKGFML